MAGEQSSGTFVAVPGETPALKALAAARVELVEALEEVAQPSLPSTGSASGPLRRGEGHSVLAARQHRNIAAESASPGRGQSFRVEAAVRQRVMDMVLPQIAEAYPAPKFGVHGTRSLTGVQALPLIGTIVKPSIGFEPEQTADLDRQLAAPASTLSRMTNCSAIPPLPVQRSRRCGDGGNQRACPAEPARKSCSRSI